jgi:predicted nucleotidyltransferase
MVNQDVIQEIINICSALNKHDVEYLIIGGTASAFHGHFRVTSDHHGNSLDKYDIDLWYDSSYKNYYSLLRALAELGEDVKNYQEEQNPDPSKSFFRFEHDRFTLDFLPKIDIDKKFYEAYMNKVVSSINDVDIYIIGLDDLISNKKHVGRQKDIDDIEKLNSGRE